MFLQVALPLRPLAGKFLAEFFNLASKRVHQHFSGSDDRFGGVRRGLLAGDEVLQDGADAARPENRRDEGQRPFPSNQPPHGFFAAMTALKMPTRSPTPPAP